MRARNIKSSLFKNEVLGTADPLLTILFEGLWCLADREGRLEDRPLRIKAEIFPYRDNLDVNGYLTELASLDFIQRYSVGGINFIQVKNFKKHQAPHKTEKPSEIPPPSNKSDKTESCSLTVKPPLNNGEATEPLPPDSLIPDSLNQVSILAERPTFEYEVAGKNSGLSPDDVAQQYKTFRNWYLSRPDPKITSYFPLWENWLDRHIKQQKETKNGSNQQNYRQNLNGGQRKPSVTEATNAILADIASGNF